MSDLPDVLQLSPDSVSMRLSPNEMRIFEGGDRVHPRRVVGGGSGDGRPDANHRVGETPPRRPPRPDLGGGGGRGGGVRRRGPYERRALDQLAAFCRYLGA